MDFTKDHKSKVSSLLMERWGFKAPKNKEISHLCAMLVTEKATGKIGHPINHTLLEGGDVTHYDVEFDDVIIEGMPVGALDVEVQEEHQHGRREDYAHDEEKPRAQYAEVVSEEEEQSEAEFGKSKVGGQEFKKASIETSKEAGSGGFTGKERGIVSDLQKKLVAAAEAGDIVTGKALKLAKLLAAELDAMVAKK
jgi:hypothetical protein